MFQHCLGVKDTAVRLAQVYGLDPVKAELTGIIHDYGKLFSHNELIQVARSQGMDDPLIYREPALLHAPVGAVLLKDDLGVEDPEILEAVRVHTTGSPEMSLLARIIYLADYIEPGRDCPGVETIRQLAYLDLQGALLAAVDFTIHYIMERKRLLHPSSIAFRNSLVLSMRNYGQELSGYETK